MERHTQSRLEIAHLIAPFYAVYPHLEAVFVFGSVARGWADEFSDLEIGAIWSQAPDEDALRDAAIQAGATEWKMEPFNEARQSLSEMFYVDGLRIETAHWTRAAIESIVADVLERFDVSQNFLLFEKQATVSALQHAIVLHGAETMKLWRERIAIYPTELAEAMVRKHLRFSSFGSREMLAARGEIPLLYENHCHSVRLLLNLLLGLNHIYHPTFKWTRFLVEEMKVAPSDLFARLERVFQTDAVRGTQELRSLIEESFDLVTQHLPQIDLTAQREEFAKPYPSWPSR